MYISVSDAAEKFNLSKRKIQILCEQGHIEGANWVRGVWYIPHNANQLANASKNRYAQVDDVSFNNKSKLDKKISFDQVCEILSISSATAKNWIRLGKLIVDEDGKSFNESYIEELLFEIKNGNGTRLKKRRNKKNVSGKILYKDYIKNNNNRIVVECILEKCNRITDEELRIILAAFAAQLYQQSGGEIVSNESFFLRNIPVFKNPVFNDLILDLIDNISFHNIDFTIIDYILNFEIQYVSSEDTLGFVYISLRDLGLRKQTGAYYTPDNTVDMLIGNLINCLDLNNKTICDPCCGTGNFLIGLVDAGVKTSQLYAQDIDEVSILITRINMFLLNNELTKDLLNSHFKCENALLKSFPMSFSVVLGNPPWGYEFSKEEKEMFAKSYSTARNKGMDSFDLFIERGISILEKGGYLAYVLPESLLSVSSHLHARNFIIKNCDFKFISYLGNVFAGVQCPAIVLGLKSEGNGNTKNCKILSDNIEFTIKENREINSSLFSFNMNDDEYNCLRQISSLENVKYLRDNAQFALGIVTGNNKDYIKTRIEDGHEIILKGSDVLRYSLKDPNNYIQFLPEVFQQVAPTEVYRAKEKLLYRFISEVPVFTYDNQQRLSLNSCNIVIPNIPGLHIKYILAILNSSVAAYFISKKFNSIKLLRSHIEQIPIPMVSCAVQDRIIKKVDCLMSSSQNIDNLYFDLDLEIAHLFNLSSEQINIIKNALREKNYFFDSSK